MSIDPEFQAPAGKGGRRGCGFHFVEILLIAAILAVLVALILPATRSSTGAAKRAQCTNNMKQILLGLHNYHDTYGRFPPPWTTDAQGRKLHSWRTLLLPFVEQEALYKTIDLTRPWDDPVNAAAFRAMPNIYRCPSSTAPEGFTSYLGIVGPRNAFRPDGSRKLDEFIDGTSNTIMLVDVEREAAVPWMAPRDAGEALFVRFKQTTSLPHPGIFQAGMADGAVRFIKTDTPEKTLAALITLDGGEAISADDY